MFAGRVDEGIAAAIDVIARARELHLDEELAPACRLLGSDPSEILELASPTVAAEGVEIAERANCGTTATT